MVSADEKQNGLPGGTTKPDAGTASVADTTTPQTNALTTIAFPLPTTPPPQAASQMI
jgi:hypothetical protein